MAAAITSAAIGVAAAGYSIYQGESQKKKAKAELNSYERQELINAAEQIEISTRGTDLMREESQRTVANMIDALQGGGGRMLAANLGQLQAGINQTNRQIQKDLDDQVMRREYAIADENARLRGIREERDMQNIGALQSQYTAGDQNMWNGINGAIAATGSLGRAIGDTPKKSNTSVKKEVVTPYSADIKNISTTDIQNSINSNPVNAYNAYQPFGIGSNIPGFSLPAVDNLFTEKSMYKGNNIV
ncbi:hypothetical protein AV926_14065 [Myroides marinus]|uniref:Uncharacterized protein n=1 Tax=Myroides marinus TaxID=703342 RepID=A0A163X8Q2_9FLAO|nr:hypothetical protein [Myroides marinus]KZE77496.1 hypothetical protein AV926_14065 [Myroides marinus]